MDVYSITVRDGMDWAEFFVSEREPRERDGHKQYSATWACVSSFGTYGHHWSHMGKPFKEFVQPVDRDYLLSKIATMQPDGDTTIASVRREVLRRRRENYVTADAAREAWSAIDAIESDGNGEVSTLLYNDDDVSRVVQDWCDMTTTAYDRSTVCFAERMWPLFCRSLLGLDEKGGGA